MTNEDLKYLKNARPEELLRLTNGIPSIYCALIRVCLLRGQVVLAQGTEGELGEERVKWAAAGAVYMPAEDIAWFRERADLSANCDECGNIRYLPNRDHKRGRRVSFTRAGGFRWMELCAECIGDHDLFHYPGEVVKLATRWQGRCLTPQGVAQ